MQVFVVICTALSPLPDRDLKSVGYFYMSQDKMKIKGVMVAQ